MAQVRVEGGRLAEQLTEMSALVLSKDARGTLQRVAELATEAVPGCDAASISVLGEDGVATSAWTDDAVLAVDAVQYQNSGGPCVDALSHNQPTRMDSVASGQRWPAFASAASEHGLASVLALPLSVEGRAIGTLNLYARLPGAFDESAERLGRLFANHAAVALHNARVYSSASHVADVLQRSLLPPMLATVPGIELAARYLPATTWNVAGDWYDTISLPGHRLGLVIGDVAGHGVRAASIMGQVRTAVRAYAFEGHPPAATLQRLQRLFLEVEPDAMATLGYLVVDAGRPSEGVPVRWATAGHPPPLLIWPRGQASYLENEPGPPLGAPSSAVFAENQAVLEPGATLLLFTDGLVERPDRPLAEGLGALQAAVVDAPAPLEDLCDWVVDALLEDVVRTDDVAVLALHVGDR